MTITRRAIRSPAAEPRLRRAYFDCRFGQLHVHYAMPSSGGFDEATTLLCLPGHPGSGRFYRPLLLPLAQDRTVYAPDLPGYGESDPSPGGADPADAAAAMADFVDSMRIRRIDLLAHDTAVPIAMALLQLRPTLVGRIVLSPGTEAVRAQMQASRHPALMIDLSPVDGPATDLEQVARQAGELRAFLRLV